MSRVQDVSDARPIVTRKGAMAAGLTRYFTGKPCKRGHVTERYSPGGNCCECIRSSETAELHAKWLKENTERVKEGRARYRKSNADKIVTYNRNRSALRKEADGRHTAEDIAAIRIAQKDKCAMCRTKLRGGGHVDHIQPLARGGSNWPRNLQLLCAPCNLSKHAQHPLDFAQSRGFLL